MADTKPNTPKPTNPEPIASATCEGTLLALAVDCGGGVAYVGGSSGAVEALDLNAPAWKLRPKIPGAFYVSGLQVVRRDGFDDQLVVARYDGSLAWHRTHDLRETQRVADAHRGWIRDLALTADGTRLATVGDDMLVKLWDARGGKLLHSFAGHAPETPQGYVSALYAVAAAPDGRHWASGDRVGDIHIWDSVENRQVHRLQCAEFYTFDPEKRDRSIGGIRRLRFSPDGRLLAVAGIGQITNVDGFVGPCRIEIWDWQAGQRVATLQDTHQAVLNDLLWTADSQRLVASGGGDGGGVIVVWSVKGEKPEQKIKLKGHTQRMAWLRQDEQFLAAGHESVQLWDLAVAEDPKPSAPKTPLGKT